MLGLRGVRLGIHMPALARMQVRAIFEAACACAKEGVKVNPKIMIPLAGHWRELEVERERSRTKPAAHGNKAEVDYKFGTMIEVPRAALMADRLAEFAEFF